MVMRLEVQIISLESHLVDPEAGDVGQTGVLLSLDSSRQPLSMILAGPEKSQPLPQPECI